MKGLLMLALFLACSVPAVRGGFRELKTMIEQVTGKDAIKNYGFYGCYCGWGGRGVPKDGTDRCCRMHDLCYEQLEEKNCPIRILSYDYRFINGLVFCERDSFCPERLCACDQKLAYCLERNLWSYNSRYRFYFNFFC